MSFLSTFENSLENEAVIWLFFSLLIGVYLVYLQLYYARTPPGPWGLPLFGYLLFFTKKPYEDFVKLARKYGNVFSVKIGSRYVVVLNDYEVIQETFVKQADIYAGKPLDGMTAKKLDYKSVFVTDGKLWRTQRSFLLSSLRDFGFGKKRMEERIQEEAELMIKEFIKKKNQLVPMKEPISYIVTNVIGYLLFGQRFNYDDKESMKYLNLMCEIVSEQSHFTISDAFPKLQAVISSSMFGLDKYESMKKEVYKFVDLKIKEHKETFDANHIRDVIDTYLLKLEQINETGQLTSDNVFTNDYVRANALDLFTAGTETTISTLNWVFKILAVHRDVQTEIQREIDETIGRERPPSMGDKIKMPFTQATLLELDRFISLLPLTLYHRLLKDTVLKDYKIPKNTLVLANLWNVHYNTDIWKDPFQFNPRRFLDSDGKINDLREYVISFSVGKRSCLGESLAKMEIFLFVTCFLQKLTFSPEINDTNLDIIHEIPVRKLKPYSLLIKMRD